MRILPCTRHRFEQRYQALPVGNRLRRNLQALATSVAEEQVSFSMQVIKMVIKDNVRLRCPFGG